MEWRTRSSRRGRGSIRRILLTITKTAGANVIETVNRVIQAVLPQLLGWISRRTSR